jgi:hypothetical protein
MVFQASAIEYDPASQNTILDYEVKVYKRLNTLIINRLNIFVKVRYVKGINKWTRNIKTPIGKSHNNVC